jgi:hypothetical protein
MEVDSEAALQVRAKVRIIDIRSLAGGLRHAVLLRPD